MMTSAFYTTDEADAFRLTNIDSSPTVLQYTGVDISTTYDIEKSANWIKAGGYGKVGLLFRIWQIQYC